MTTRYIVNWTEEVWHRSIVEADSWEEARDKFYEYDIETDKITGGEIQDSVEIVEEK